MLSVSILTVKNKTINSLGVVEPLISNKELFYEVGIKIKKIFLQFKDVADTDVLIVDSKYFKQQWKLESENILSQIDWLRTRVNRLYWFDSGDSTGIIQPLVFPFVDGYLKAQVLKDRTQYRKNLYGGRVFTDYYHKTAHIEDSNPIVLQGITAEEVTKIKTAWNYGLVGGYGTPGNYLDRIKARVMSKLYHPRQTRYTSRSQPKTKDIFLRMNLHYDRETVAYQRNITIEQLVRHAEENTHVPKWKYLQEMEMSKVIVSPFGWGEINIRDFECFVSMGILLKPNMAHLETFPDYYRDGETYIPFSWTLSDLNTIVEDVLGNYTRYYEVAMEGKKYFSHFIEDLSGRQKFVTHVSQLLTN